MPPGVEIKVKPEVMIPLVGFDRWFCSEPDRDAEVGRRNGTAARSHADKCGDVVMAALWMTGNLSNWSETPDLKPCENCLNPEVLEHLHASGLIEEPPVVDCRPIRFTAAGQWRAFEAYQRLYCQ